MTLDLLPGIKSSSNREVESSDGKPLSLPRFVGYGYTASGGGHVARSNFPWLGTARRDSIV
ncbi:unnamed protein product [Linum tenue]|uniref:Uncharacterized protein n=1 Tax=Linum tenue TaxID=586396 RepID=A0AAV0MGF9_9ROSI|nr:unnamed protein product [Linum tenue]